MNLRGRIITEDGGSSGDESESDEDSDENGDDVSEVKWSIPEGFKLAQEPAELDGSLVGAMVYLRWKTFGWQMGKIYDIVTSATPRV